MATIFVCRHQGAMVWMKKQSIAVDFWTDDLCLESVRENDKVIGILPMHLAAAVCARGAKFYALELNVPKLFRGRELSENQLKNFDCSLREYEVVAKQSPLKA